MDKIVDILVPDLPESVVDATIVTWHKKIGDHVKYNEVLVDIETDKVILEVPSPKSGILKHILQDNGTTVVAKQIIGHLCIHLHKDDQDVHPNPKQPQSIINQTSIQKNIITDNHTSLLSPSIRRLVAQYNLDEQKLQGTGIGGRITREDIEKQIMIQQNDMTPLSKQYQISANNERNETKVPMSRLRQRIAERLLEAKNNTAILTTFNEADMSSIIELRKKYGESFEKKHKIKLGFMSFYVKAVSEALKLFPEINASIDGDNIIYRDYFDVSIAISTPRGLVTPVLKNIDKMSMAEIENNIKTLAVKGREGKLKIEDLVGGNFTITNGGVFGSLMSTPIINPPQSAILGIHAIKDRPMAINGNIVVLPMMYLALSYDHRLIDGKEAVSFVIIIKNILEDPVRLLLDI